MSWKTGLTLSTSILAALITAVSSASGALPTADPTVPAKHDADPIILTGANFPQWSARSNQTAKLPLTALQKCSGTGAPSRGSSPNDWLVADQGCEHNHFEQPEVDTGDKL